MPVSEDEPALFAFFLLGWFSRSMNPFGLGSCICFIGGIY